MGANPVFMLQTWIKGQSLNKVLPILTEKEQYSLGLQAGEILKRIHSYKPKNSHEYIRYRLVLSGVENLNRFFKMIGSKNPVKLSRFQIWQKIGFCPTNTSYLERQDILNGKVNLY